MHRASTGINVTTKLLGKVKSLKNRAEEAKKMAITFEGVKYFKDMVIDTDERVDFLSQACQYVKQITYHKGYMIYTSGEFGVEFGIIHQGSAGVYQFKDEEKIKLESQDSVKTQIVDKYIDYILQAKIARRVSNSNTPYSRGRSGSNTPHRAPRTQAQNFSDAVNYDRGSNRRSSVRHATLGQAVTERNHGQFYHTLLDEITSPKAKIIPKQVKETHGDLTFEEKVVLLNSIVFNRRFVKESVILLEKVETLRPGSSFADMSLIRDIATKDVIFVDGNEPLKVLHFSLEDYKIVFNKRVKCLLERKEYLEYMFPKLSKELIRKMSYYLEERQFNGSTSVYNEGDEPDDIFFLKKGEVQLTKSVNDDPRENYPNSNVIKVEKKKSFASRKAIVVGSIMPGGTFGEYEVIKKKKRFYTAKTSSGMTICYVLRGKTYFNIFEKYLPYAVSSFMSLIRKKLKWRYQREIKENQMTDIIKSGSPEKYNPANELNKFNLFSRKPTKQSLSPSSPRIPSPSKSRLYKGVYSQQIMDQIDKGAQSRTSNRNESNPEMASILKELDEDQISDQNSSVLTEDIERKTLRHTDQYKSQAVNENVIVRYFDPEYDKLMQKKKRESFRLFHMELSKHIKRPKQYNNIDLSKITTQNTNHQQQKLPKKIQDRLRSRQTTPCQTEPNILEDPGHTVSQNESPVKSSISRSKSPSIYGNYQRKKYFFEAPIRYMDPDLASQRILRYSREEAHQELLSKLELVKINRNDSSVSLEELEERGQFDLDQAVSSTTQIAAACQTGSFTERPKSGNRVIPNDSRKKSAHAVVASVVVKNVKQRPSTGKLMSVKSYKPSQQQNEETNFVIPSFHLATEEGGFREELEYQNQNKEISLSESFHRWKKTPQQQQSISCKPPLSASRNIQTEASILKKQQSSIQLQQYNVPEQSLAEKYYPSKTHRAAAGTKKKPDSSKSLTDVTPSRPATAKTVNYHMNNKRSLEKQSSRTGIQASQILSRQQSARILQAPTVDVQTPQFRKLPKDIKSDDLIVDKSSNKKPLKKGSVGIFRRILGTLPTREESTVNQSKTEYGILNPKSFNITSYNKESSIDKIDQTAGFTQILSDYAFKTEGSQQQFQFQQVSQRSKNKSQELSASKQDVEGGQKKKKPQFFIQAHKVANHVDTSLTDSDLSQSNNLLSSPQKIQLIQSARPAKPQKTKTSSSLHSQRTLLRKKTVG